MQTPEELIKTYEKNTSLTTFLDQFEKTTIPAIYQNPNKRISINPKRQFLFIINGTTGSGKDTLIKLLVKNDIAQNVQTATNRPKRPREPAENYLWMRQQADDENEKEYIANLVAEYNLIEHDKHAGNVYGLPRQNLLQAQNNLPILVQNEPHGAETLTNELADTFNVVVLFLIPDSWQTIFKRISKEGHQRDKLTKRIRYSHEQLSLSLNTTHFYIHSTTKPTSYGLPKNVNGLTLLYESTTELITGLLDDDLSFMEV